jgi:hypothetical protein
MRHAQVDVATGAVLRAVALPRHLFGEGVTRVGDRLLQLTWQRGTMLEYSNVSTFHNADTANFTAGAAVRDTGLKDGWGITYDGKSLIVSDSSIRMRWLDPLTLALQKEAVVRDGGTAVQWVNELEWINGEVRRLSTDSVTVWTVLASSCTPCVCRCCSCSQYSSRSSKIFFALRTEACSSTCPPRVHPRTAMGEQTSTAIMHSRYPTQPKRTTHARWAQHPVTIP